MNNIVIIGGDDRQKSLFEILKAEGYNCEYVYKAFTENDFERIKDFDTVILPIPLSKDGKYIYSKDNNLKIEIAKLLSYMSQKQVLIFGSANKALTDEMQERNIRYYDLFSEEAFVLYNAYLTAQGTLLEILKYSKEYLCGKKVLVLGYGRVGKAVADLMYRNKTDVYVAARNPSQIGECECLGYNTMSFSELKSTIYLFDYIVSTVPFNVLSSLEVSLIRDDALFVELASAPYSAKEDWFSKYNKRYVLASGLPGKYMSVACAKKIAELVIKYIS